MFNNILVLFNFLFKKMPVNVEIKCSLKENFEGLQCHRTASCHYTNITLTSNAREGHNFLIHGIKRVTIFYADVKGGS